MEDRFLGWVYRLVRRRAWWVLGATLFLALLAVAYTFFISELQVKSSFLDLLPQHDPLVRRFEQAQPALERIDYLQILITLRHPPPEEAERERLLLAAAERLIARLRQSPEIISANDRPDVALPEVMLLSGQGELLERLLKTSTAIQAQLQGEAASLEGQRLAEFYAQVNDALEKVLTSTGATGTASNETPTPEELEAQLEGLRGLTLGIRRTVETLAAPGELEERIAELLALLDEVQRQANEQIFFSQDRTSILVNARPRLSSQVGLVYDRMITKLVREAIAATLDPAEFEVGLTGSYIFAAESDALIKQDMRNTTIISAIGVALIFIWAFGRVFFPLLGTIPLFLAMLLTLAWAKLAVGGLNLITTFLPSLIMGLGIDYGVHFIARYLEERERGARIGPALERMIRMKGRATFIAALTTAVVFFSLLLARSRGIFEMGVVGGMGILIAFALTLFVLPALILISHLVLRRAFRGRPARYRLNLRGFIALVLRHRRVVLILAVLGSLALLYPATQIRFQFVSENLVPEGMPSQLVRQRIAEKYNLAELRIGDYFVFFAPDEGRLREIVTELRKLDLVEDVHSMADYLPGGAMEVPASLDILARLEEGKKELALVEANLDDRERIVAEAERLIVNLSSLQAISTFYGQEGVSKAISAAMGELVGLTKALRRIDPAEVRANIAELEGWLERLAARVRRMFGEGDPLSRALEFLRERFQAPNGDYIIYVKVDSERIYQKRYYEEFIAAAERITPDFFGAAMIQDRLEWYMSRDFWVTTTISVLLVVGFLWLGFRRRGWLGPLALLPLALGYLWMLGGMRLLGLEFNFMNILISPLLIGLGIDNGVHLLHRYLETHRLKEAATTIAVPIFTTSATTLLVFGSLLLARTPGLRVLGTSALLGLGFNALFSLTLLPALLAHRGRGD